MYNKAFHQVDLSQYSFLITGGAGFVGSNIAKYLLKFGAKKLRILDNLSTGNAVNIEEFMQLDNFEFLNGDIADYSTCLEATKGIDYVCHQAALGSVPRSLADPISTNKANVDGFLNMITAARKNEVKRVVFASSSSVYGDSKKLPKLENEIGKPLSPYAVSKYTNELYASVSRMNYGQEIIGLRYFNIFGPNQSPNGAYAAVIPLFIDAIAHGKAPFINGDGTQSRDFTFVENAVKANVCAFFTQKEEAFGEVFNIAVGEQYTLLDLFSNLKGILKSDVEVAFREERAGDIQNSLADISKSKKLLGYEPEVRFEDGLQITVDWFLSEKNKFRKNSNELV